MGCVASTTCLLPFHLSILTCISNHKKIPILLLILDEKKARILRKEEAQLACDFIHGRKVCASRKEDEERTGVGAHKLFVCECKWRGLMVMTEKMMGMLIAIALEVIIDDGVDKD